MMSKRVLISGVEGFTGRYLATELNAAGYEVFGVAYQKSDTAVEGVKEIYACDLCDAKGLAALFAEVRPNKVAHLAAIYRTNVVGTRYLLDALVQSGCKPDAVLLANSANTYGNAMVEPITESTMAAPANDYAVSKLAMEYMARLWMDKLPITMVRPFNYTGVGQSLNFLLPKIVDHFRRKAPVLELGNLDVVRDFSDVRSVVKRYRLLLDSDQAGDVFNVCSGQGYSLLQVVQMMRELSGHAPEIRVNPAFVRANEVHRLVGSAAKLDAAIGKVDDIPLRETLRWMLEQPA
jgi:nucleoside-diphosphate-sugar epimerase